MAGEALAPQFYVDKTTHGLAMLRMFTSLTFMYEIWGVSIMSFSNTPYWSLCYEMWYYIFFAMVTFTRAKPRILLVSAAALLVGPKILLLAPIWMLGVILHRWKLLYRIPEWLGWLLFVLSLLLYALFQDYEMTEAGSALLRQWIGEKWHRNLTFSKFFLTDYPLALIIAANFLGFRSVAHRCTAFLVPLEKPIRWVAGFTFSLYIFHQPLIQFFAAVINGNPNNAVFYFQVIACTFATIVIVVSYFERQRHPLRQYLKQRLLVLCGTRWWQRQVTMRLVGKTLT